MQVAFDKDLLGARAELANFEARFERFERRYPNRPRHENSTRTRSTQHIEDIRREIESAEQRRIENGPNAPHPTQTRQFHFSTVSFSDMLEQAIFSLPPALQAFAFELVDAGHQGELWRQVEAEFDRDLPRAQRELESLWVPYEVLEQEHPAIESEEFEGCTLGRQTSLERLAKRIERLHWEIQHAERRRERNPRRVTYHPLPPRQLPDLTRNLIRLTELCIQDMDYDQEDWFLELVQSGRLVAY